MLFSENLSIAGDERISNELFGGNLLAPTVPLTGAGSYEEAINYLGVTGLRFPGGSLTEFVFDINDPDRPVVYNPDLDVTWNMIGLSDFMKYAGEVGHPVTIVIPTRTQLSDETDEIGNRFANIDEHDLRQFISSLINGDFGEAHIEAIEIGNEYWGSGQMTALEYGRLASEMSEIINDELTKYGNFEADILVQKGNNFDYSRLSDDYEGIPPDEILLDLNSTYSLDLESDALFSNGEVNWAFVNATIIMSQFDTDEEWQSVDGVVTHIYSRGELAETTRYFDLDQMNQTWIAEDPSLEIYITEWNLKSDSSLNRDEDYGLFQAQEMLQIMEEFVRSGVDNAHVWPLVQRTSNPLAEGTEFTSATPPGEMFSLMSETLPGKVLIDLSPRYRDTEFLDESVSTHMFAGENELVLYVMNASKSSGANADIDVSGFISDFGGFDAVVLGVEEGDPPGDNSSSVVVEELDASVFEDGYIQATLSPGEVMQIVFSDVVPSEGFGPLWEQANSADPFQTIEETDIHETNELPLPIIDMPEDDAVLDEDQADVEDDEVGFGIEFGLVLLVLLGLSGFGLG